MKKGHPRIDREAKTVAAMIRLYCRNNHKSKESCPNCSALMDYSLERLQKCPFGERKPTCANCPVHCYKPEMREKIRAVMRYSGPRMIYRHPLMSLFHLIDGLRKEPSPHR